MAAVVPSTFRPFARSSASNENEDIPEGKEKYDDEAKKTKESSHCFYIILLYFHIF
jgi:hypothetical protein